MVGHVADEQVSTFLTGGKLHQFLEEQVQPLYQVWNSHSPLKAFLLFAQALLRNCRHERQVA
jgi:hypothetical protein